MSKKYDFTQVDALKKRLDALRPLEAELYSKLRHKLSIDWTYNSNAIEGNTLTLSETRFFLEVGLTSKGKPLSEYLEMKNHKFALDYLESMVREKQPLSERLIKELHAMLFDRNEEYEVENEQGQKIRKSVLPGKYKLENNYVLLPDGSRKFYMDPLKVVDAMQDLIQFYEKEKEVIHPLLLASEMHARFVAIHPFVDGNGRVSRLIMNLVLMQAGYQPAIIQNSLKLDYYDALRHYDETADLEPFVAIVEQEEIRTLQITLKAAEGGAVFDVADIGKRLGHFSKTMEALDKEVGKFSKKVSDEDKRVSVRNIRDHFADIAKNRVGDLHSDLFNFKVISPMLLSLDMGDHLLEFFSKKNIDLPLERVPDTILDQDGEEAIFYRYRDSVPDGSISSVYLRAERDFIPTSSCHFLAVPTKYSLFVCGLVFVPEMKADGNEENKSPLITFIQNGVLWEDWNKSDLDHFFTEVFDQFLAMVEQEAEKRRLKMEENKQS